MQHKHLQFGHGFRVVLGDEHSQAAQMTLGPGEIEGGPDNRHQGADQWLYVVSGTGAAIIDGERVELRAGTLLPRASARPGVEPGSPRIRSGPPAARPGVAANHSPCYHRWWGMKT